MEQDPMLIPLGKLLWQKKRLIILLTVLAGAGSVVISLLLPNYYKASTTFYVASTDVTQPYKLFGASEISYFGKPEDIDRVLTFANSYQLVDQLIDTFQLFDHYEINPDQPKARFKVRKTFLKHYEVLKNKFNAIELSFEDKDREFAAQVANVARDLIDGLSRRMTEENLEQQAQIVRNTISEKNSELVLLNDSLAKLREEFGIYNTLSQSEALTSELTTASSLLAKENARVKIMEKSQGIKKDSLSLAKALVAGYQAQVQELNAQISRFNNGVSRTMAMDDYVEKVQNQLGYDRIRLEQIQSVLTAQSPGIYVVEHAETPLEKSKPKRSVLVIAATMLTFLLASLGTVVHHQLKVYLKEL